jgi:hypothetical protein
VEEGVVEEEAVEDEASEDQANVSALTVEPGCLILEVFHV